MKWQYNGAFETNPINPGETAVWENGSMARLNDIYNPTPEYMKKADLVVVDPPWNRGNVNTFYTKAERKDRIENFDDFLAQVFRNIKEIDPEVCYIEMGKEYLADCIMELRKQFKYVTFYNNTYYHKKENKCYLIRASKKAKKPDLDWMDEEDAIMELTKWEKYDCLCDFVCGRGLMARAAAAAGKPFVVGEMNHKRLSVLLKNLPGYTIEKEEE